MTNAAAVAAATVTTTPSRIITVAGIQFSRTKNLESKFRRAESLNRNTARKGANIVLLQEYLAFIFGETI